MKTIIVVSGKYRSGKDTFAKYLKEYYPKLRKVAFAYALKQIIADAMDITLGELEDYKNDGYAVLHGLPTDADIDGGNYKMQTYRSILQRFGSGAMKEIFGQSVWVDSAIRQIDQWFKYTDTVVITDWRFKHEINRLESYYKSGWDADVPHGRACDDVRILRVSVQRDSATGDEHISEVDLDDYHDYDYIADNNGTVEDLAESAKTLIDFIIQTGDEDE